MSALPIDNNSPGAELLRFANHLVETARKQMSIARQFRSDAVRRVNAKYEPLDSLDQELAEPATPIEAPPLITGEPDGGELIGLADDGGAADVTSHDRLDRELRDEHAHKLADAGDHDASLQTFVDDNKYNADFDGGWF